ncbi:hypothetical protein [Ferrigenium sp. UT5]|uniref:hypothetical protein n=1 Tax=Ferrigenium sp. UT5 TaxID=3242105 RepID=UPI003552F966
MLSLEPTDDRAHPAFRDVASCRQWLGQLQLTNLNLAHASLRTEIDELNRLALPGRERLQVLEALRETVAQVQHDFARKLVGKALPLADEEFALLTALANLWQALFDGYLRCLLMVNAGDASLGKKLPLLYQRCFYYARCRLNAFTGADYAPDSRSWQQLHALYAAIEASPLRQEAVRDPYLHEGLPVTCQSLYLATLLVHRARLLGLPRSQLHLAEHWLLRWPDTLTLVADCSASRNDAPPLALDLRGSQGLIGLARAQRNDSLRFLPLVPLSKQLRVKTILLKQGQSPRQLDLGDTLPAQDCIKLLDTLHACWCEARDDSLADAPRPATRVHLCAGLEKIYGQIAQKPFKPVKDLSKAVRDAQLQIATFGRELDQTGQHKLQKLGFAPEEWQAESNGLLQARLLRLHRAGDRIAPRQIVLVFPPDSDDYRAGMVAQIEVTQGGLLYLVVHYLPGKPQAMVAQATATDQPLLQSSSAPALRLPALDQLHIPASLVLPRNWFVSGRELELTAVDRSRHPVTLGISVETGSDYQRVSFSPA